MNVLIIFFLFLNTLIIPVHANEMAIGKISFSKGSNAAQQPNAELRLLGKGAEIYQGDNIQTSDESVVIVEFVDHSKVTVRPNSNFKIEQFDNETKNVKLSIYEGGLRVSTGEFADNFQIKTPTKVLNADKSSDYSVSVCKEDCDKKESAKEVSVAKVVEIKGDVFAKNSLDKNATERKLALGNDINAHDHLSSQASSFLVIVFRDNQKITLQPNSEFDIVKYDYQQEGKKDQIAFKLFSGGLRALTGLIGKKDHSAYVLDTPVATIGIRGTETEHVENPDGSGIYSHVTEGSIVIKNEAGEVVLNQGQNSFTQGLNMQTVQLLELPQLINFQLENTPRPNHAPDFMLNLQPNSNNSIVKMNDKFTPPNGLNKATSDGINSNVMPQTMMQNLNHDEEINPKLAVSPEMSDNLEHKELGNNPMMNENVGQFKMDKDDFNMPKNMPDSAFSNSELNSMNMDMNMNIGDAKNIQMPPNFSSDISPSEFKKVDMMPILNGKLSQKVVDYIIEKGELDDDDDYNFTYDDMKLKGEHKNIPIPSIIIAPVIVPIVPPVDLIKRDVVLPVIPIISK